MYRLVFWKPDFYISQTSRGSSDVTGGGPSLDLDSLPPLRLEREGSART
jgi:hypothetical protein